MGVLLRVSGPYVQSEIHAEADSTMTVGTLDRAKSSIQDAVKGKFTGIQRVVVSAKTWQG